MFIICHYSRLFLCSYFLKTQDQNYSLWITELFKYKNRSARIYKFNTYSSLVTNNHCLNVIIYRSLRFWKFHIFHFECLLHSLSRNCFTLIISIFFTSHSKNVITYITLTVINMLNNKTKQYYCITEMFKALVIVKKKKFSRTNILI